jgi:hypothetical protein
MVHRRARELGHRSIRVSAPGAGKPHRLHSVQRGAIEDHPGGDHPLCIRAVCGALSARTHETGLFMGRTVPVRRGLFHVSVVVSFSEVR